MAKKDWLFDEFRAVGVDYADPGVVREYDERHGTFRDYEKEAGQILDRLGLGPGALVADLGCGSGGFALSAARVCEKVHAVDVSPPMLELVREKAARAGIDNIETHHAGFLTYAHQDRPADAAVSVAALHHLPDFWKGVALGRIHSMLRPGGKFYLFDVVFSFKAREHEERIDSWLDAIRNLSGPDVAEESVVHVRDEFSTFDWVMQGLIERAGFRIEDQRDEFPFCRSYVAVKPG